MYDTSVFVYALGRDHPMRVPCRAVLTHAESGRLRGEASADLVQELAHQRYRQTGDRSAAAASARRVARVCVLHTLAPEDVLRGVELFEEGHLQGRDASFAAVALRRGVDVILSADKAYDELPGLERVDPADAEAVERLAGG